VFLIESRTDGKFYAAKAFTKSQIELGDEEALMVRISHFLKPIIFLALHFE